jgi:16S rRNA processing protein RimM
MIDLTDCYNLGTITKPHGIRGQVVLRLNNLGFDDILNMGTVFFEIDGLPVPFFIDEFSERDHDAITLTVEDIPSEQKARELVNCKVFVKNNTLKIRSVFEQEYDKLVGYEVFDKIHGRLGILENIDNFQMNRLFHIVKEKKDYLIPVQPEFIIKIDKKHRQLTLNTPEGLIELF